MLPRRSFVILVAFLALAFGGVYVKAFSLSTGTSARNAWMAGGASFDFKLHQSSSSSDDDAGTCSRRAFASATTTLLFSVALPTAPSFAAPTTDDDSNNAFIQELKARSDANRDRYTQQARLQEKLDSTQFSSQYKRPTYSAVRRMDGSFRMVTSEVADDWQAKGLVIAEYDNMEGKDGEIKPDYRKGKILQFPNESAQAKADGTTSKPTEPPPAPPTAPPAPEINEAAPEVNEAAS